ncbi:hypothetical protein D9611_014840 [Ephemerocybe angulata]|uniref:Uncharacterized protein n=1 Tax=Ephemerocybe angulata TaxID=980116 RepID=A0A8H5BU19_9AGAR|nr:hypothetical protein D9611_014840 [Tulosesus angulatus]
MEGIERTNDQSQPTNKHPPHTNTTTTNNNDDCPPSFPRPGSPQTGSPTSANIFLACRRGWRRVFRRLWGLELSWAGRASGRVLLLLRRRRVPVRVHPECEYERERDDYGDGCDYERGCEYEDGHRYDDDSEYDWECECDHDHDPEHDPDPDPHHPPPKSLPLPPRSSPSSGSLSGSCSRARIRGWREEVKFDLGIWRGCVGDGEEAERAEWAAYVGAAGAGGGCSCCWRGASAGGVWEKGWEGD